MQKFFNRLFKSFSDDAAFLRVIGKLETFVSKLLSIGMIIVIIVAVGDLAVYLGTALLTEASEKGFFKSTLIEIFGLFLSILIALEVLENITAYLRKHVIQTELVIATSLTAVARKIIILDLNKISGIDIIGLAIAIFALSISYWIVRRSR
jgi:uncharacterized membrane protein (DUF373 family)